MEPLIKGDSIELEITANTDITDWKIRYEFYDKEGNSVQGATSNSGGSDDQVEVTDASDGVFLIKVAKNLTTNFENQAYLEIEREDADEKIKTIFQGEIEFKDEQITWSSPS